MSNCQLQRNSLEAFTLKYFLRKKASILLKLNTLSENMQAIQIIYMERFLIKFINRLFMVFMSCFSSTLITDRPFFCFIYFYVHNNFLSSLMDFKLRSQTVIKVLYSCGKSTPFFS